MFYAIVIDVGPSRATVLYCGTAAEVLAVLDSQPLPSLPVPEDHRICAVDRRHEPGVRLWHAGRDETWVSPDTLRGLHRCASPACPGLPWRASDHRHPCPTSATEGDRLRSLGLPSTDLDDETPLDR